MIEAVWLLPQYPEISLYFSPKSRPSGSSGPSGPSGAWVEIPEGGDEAGCKDSC